MRRLTTSKATKTLSALMQLSISVSFCCVAEIRELVVVTRDGGFGVVGPADADAEEEILGGMAGWGLVVAERGRISADCD